MMSSFRSAITRACGGLLVACLVLVPLLATAQEAGTDRTVASVWYMWPKAGQAQAFEEALREHAAWRKQAGEGFDWRIYAPVAGSDMGHYVVRSGEHAWSDFDANRKWGMDNQAGANFERHVGPHVERYEHYFTDDQRDLSYWNTTEDFPMYEVTTLRFAPGKYGEFRRQVGALRAAATAQKWSGQWGLASVTGGDDDMTLVIPLRSYADMAGPSPTIMEMMATQMGGQDKAVETMRGIQSAIEASNTTVYVHRRDLSTPAD